MNPTQFLKEVIKLYHKARKPVFTNNKIRRGRSHSVAPAVEDLFASYLIQKIRCDSIYVDQPLSITGRKVQIYPDLVIVRNKKIVALCDIKMDLGWKRRELYNFCKRHARLIKQIRGKECKIRDGVTKEDKFYTIDKKVSLNIIIVSDQNINRAMLRDHLSKIKSLGSGKLLEIFILTQGEHPNTYGYSVNELMKKITVNSEEFKKLTKKLSR